MTIGIASGPDACVHPTRREFTKAFTLIELLVVIAIAATLAAILFPVFQKVRENARRASRQSSEKHLCASVAQTAAEPVSVALLTQEEMDVNRLPLLHDWTSCLQSSYDRTGGNDDSGHFISGDGNEGTVAEMNGPGAVVRIWSARPDGQIKIYIDDSPVPVIDKPFRQLFDGSFAPFTAGLSEQSSGGNFTYLPMPYQHHCRIVLDNGGNIFYHVNFVQFAPGTLVRPFRLPLAIEDQAAVDAANTLWAKNALPAAPGPSRSAVRQVPPRRLINLGSYHGPSVIQKITLAAPSTSDSDLRLLVLRAFFDGHERPDIQAPVSDFFGNAFGRKPFRTLLLSCSADGTLAANFPMPFAKSARFTLENDTSHVVSLKWDIQMQKQPFHPADEGYFHALWTQEITQQGKPHVWTHIKDQRGKFVGVVQAMRSNTSLGYLEGDDQFRVDNQAWSPGKTPSTVVGPWNGTGTEDAFNSGWYFTDGPTSQPMNALLVKDNFHGDIDCLRWFFNDAPTFKNSLDAQIEHGSGNNWPGVYYASVAYWYSRGPARPWFSQPTAAQLPLPKVSPLFVIPQAIEGESLIAAAKCSAGMIRHQPLQDFGNRWSGGDQLFWSGDQKPGDTLTLTFNQPVSGTYTLIGYFSKAYDYGQVAFQLNGKALGMTYDGFQGYLTPSGPVVLGLVALPAGSSNLVVTVVGKSDHAGGFRFGLDALALIPPGAAPTPIPTDGPPVAASNGS